MAQTIGGDVALYRRLDAQLLALVDHLAALLRAARVVDEDDQPDAAGGPARRRVPSDMLEVLAGRLVLTGHEALATVGELKRSAAVGDFTAMMDSMRSTRDMLTAEATAADRRLVAMQADMQATLARVEASYYASPHRPPPPPHTLPSALSVLCLAAVDTPDSQVSGGGSWAERA